MNALYYNNNLNAVAEADKEEPLLSIFSMNYFLLILDINYL